MARVPTTGPTETNTSATGSPTNAPARVSSTGPAATATREISSRGNSTARASTTGPTETVTRESSRTAISTVTVLNTMPTAPARPAGGNTTISWDKRPYRKSGRPTIQTPAFPIPSARLQFGENPPDSRKSLLQMQFYLVRRTPAYAVDPLFGLRPERRVGRGCHLEPMGAFHLPLPA